MKEIQGIVPTNFKELTRALLATTPQSRLVSGGTDLVIELNRMEHEINTLIALNRVKEMKGVRVKNKTLLIGGNVSFTELQHHPLVKKHAPALSVASSLVGSPQIRNRGTIAGNIANASPCGDSLPPLIVYGAEIQVMDAKGNIRDKSVPDIVTGPGENCLSPNEVIVGVKIPLKSKAYKSHFVKLGTRQTVTIAKINMALGFEHDTSSGKICHPKVALGAVDVTARRFEEAEELLRDQVLSQNLTEKLADILSEAITDSIKNRPTMPYKKEAVRGLVDDMLSHFTAP
jgi:CO/xanthine dehydrogenase FAD-binding subunit